MIEMGSPEERVILSAFSFTCRPLHLKVLEGGIHSKVPFYNVLFTIMAYSESNDSSVFHFLSRYLHYVFDLGNGANLIKGSSNKPLNDNQWHNVMISRDTSNLHTVKIDTKITTQITAGARNLDLKSKYWLSHSVQLLYSVHE